MGGGQRARVRTYYDATLGQYRLGWHPLYKHLGYWDEQARTHGRSLERILEVMAEAVGLAPGMRVLDAGCGVGGGALWIAGRYPGTRVEGITLSPREAERAAVHAAAAGLSARVRFSVQDYTATEFPDARFDVVWAHESVCHAEDKGAFCREAFRVLKPGGRLVIADGFLRRAPTPAEVSRFRRWADGWAIPGLPTLEGLVAELVAHGFTGVRGRDLTPWVWPSCRRLYRLAAATWPLALLLRAVGKFGPVELANHRSALLQYRLFRDGLLAYGLIVAQRPAGGGPGAGPP